MISPARPGGPPTAPAPEATPGRSSDAAVRTEGAAPPADAGTDPVTDVVTDAALLVRIIARDARALDALYGRYGRPAYSLARRVCADRVLAEDVVQEVFLTVWREPRRFDQGRGTVGSWLMTIVHHKAVDAVRREATRRRHHPLAERPEDTASEPAPLASAADRLALGAVLADQVRAALGRLPREQRETLGLAYYGGYTQREVAALTGVPIGTVKSRMFAGVARLRVLLGPVLGPAADVLGDLA